MVYYTLSDLTNNYKKKDYLVDIVYDIVSLVKERKYSLAFNSLKQNNLSFSALLIRTQRLKLKDLVKFADYVINQTKNNG